MDRARPCRQPVHRPLHHDIGHAHLVQPLRQAAEARQDKRAGGVRLATAAHPTHLRGPHTLLHAGPAVAEHRTAVEPGGHAPLGPVQEELVEERAVRPQLLRVQRHGSFDSHFRTRSVVRFTFVRSA